jgi:hypothetical protein
MRLTVGSLPPAVYWRRRAVVLGVLLVVVIIMWSSCSGPSKSDAGATRTGATKSASPQASPSTSAAVLTPTIATTSDTPTSVAPVAPPPSNTPATASACTDADLQLTAAPETATAPNGAYLKFYLRIKNISGRPCTRDLGADHQELYLQQGTTKVWSSDACNSLHGSDVVTMEPNIVHEFSNNWTGQASNNGCTNRKPPGIGKYELFARLDTKISEPANVQLT